MKRASEIKLQMGIMKCLGSFNRIEIVWRNYPFIVIEEGLSY